MHLHTFTIHYIWILYFNNAWTEFSSFNNFLTVCVSHSFIFWKQVKRNETSKWFCILSKLCILHNFHEFIYRMRANYLHFLHLSNRSQNPEKKVVKSRTWWEFIATRLLRLSLHTNKSALLKFFSLLLFNFLTLRLSFSFIISDSPK